MANKQLFAAARGPLPPAADTRNEAGGLAYALPPKVALAKVAVFARDRGYMKDTPAVLVALLTLRSTDLARRAFERVIDNGRMLRNFVQVLRSGALGRKSLGTAPKRLVQRWLAGRSPEQLLNDAVGQSPSLSDILKMVHPRPVDPEREAIYGWLLGRRVEAERLPESVRAYESFKTALLAGETEVPLPRVNFQQLTALPLTPAHWVEIARRAPWQTLRMNLNAYARQGVLGEACGKGPKGRAPQEAGVSVGSPNQDIARELAERLRDAQAIRRARVFPYQLLATWRALEPRVPTILSEALREAMDIALENVPALPGQVYVLVDVSGSMGAPVTGYRRGASSKVTCRDAAGLVASAILRRNPATVVIAFDDRLWPMTLDARAGVAVNTQALARTGGGGTATSLPLVWLNGRQARGDLVLYLSDNESWLDSQRRGATETLRQWEAFRARNPGARLVCVDLQPYASSQAPSRRDILNIGGFSDAVFEAIARFARGEHAGEHWVAAIEAVEV
jgi:60 kDa SS-A/Ro ribonucleoprotein